MTLQDGLVNKSKVKFDVKICLNPEIKINPEGVAIPTGGGLQLVATSRSEAAVSLHVYRECKQQLPSSWLMVNALNFLHYIKYCNGLNFVFLRICFFKYLVEWQTVQIPIRLLRSSLIWVCTVCICHFEGNWGIQTFTVDNENHKLLKKKKKKKKKIESFRQALRQVQRKKGNLHHSIIIIIKKKKKTIQWQRNVVCFKGN